MRESVAIKPPSPLLQPPTLSTTISLNHNNPPNHREVKITTLYHGEVTW